MDLFVNMDESGRLVLPKSVRMETKSHSFIVEIKQEGILLRPVPDWDEAFGSVPEIDMKKFAQQHRDDSRE